MPTLKYRISRAIRRWRARRQDMLRRFTMMDLRGDDDRPRGPGWYDSSWDLVHGLDVRSTGPGEPGFGYWLDAMTRVSAAAAAAPSHPGGNAIAFDVDEADWGCGHGAGGDALAVAAVDDHRVDHDAIEWCPADVEPGQGDVGTWLASASAIDAGASCLSDLPPVPHGMLTLSAAGDAGELSLVPI